MTEPELLPCPFCGGTDLVFDGLKNTMWIRCFDCAAEGPSVARETRVDDEVEAKNRKELIRRWNTRKTSDTTL